MPEIRYVGDELTSKARESLEAHLEKLGLKADMVAVRAVADDGDITDVAAVWVEGFDNPLILRHREWCPWG